MNTTLLSNPSIRLSNLQQPPLEGFGVGKKSYFEIIIKASEIATG